ncbi:MAG: FAD-linked oxidase C-terminal domain-containing protein [Desulfobacterales bacterium]|jgi:glycolate oxidase subunit GlcD|nr:FAD-binding oxidoreductase [Desulfobacter sp.]MDP6394375.1 FAD-linked oxidase C-terminal domain-containing protein [Desulfobacterales bacterium]MDP6682402.1 FAD-linked oxidase C-terminal domain-containing protein [Desulfobacterales bacterium]MDP6807550.1 FAD-linked oxidase C-terminal domain-containing protein [Desulfobacterales bacterium]|tara:strand:- start:2920 stop:4326 length:1407 start_codon:yes stop_codon:yes gene_type:complete
MEKPELIVRLKEIVGSEHVLSSDMDLELYSYDASLDRATPDAVVLPGSTEEVSKVVTLAYKEKIPFIGRGSGTNLTGGTIPIKGGIIIHFSRMNRILEIDIPNRTATVQPGVITLDLQTHVAKLGFIYAPDPASQKVSTLGGNFGENSGGPHCLKYGVTTNHILGAEVVLDDGTVIWTGGKAQNNPGYDLTGLLVGSEGTLVIATKLILKLIRAPEAVKTMLAIYNTIEDGANTVSAIIAEGIIPATLEMMDNKVIQAVEASVHAGYPLDAAAVLIIELDGMPDGMDKKAEKISEICNRHHVREIRLAKTESERAGLWAGRKGAFGAVARLRPSYMCCDGTVPRTRLPEALAKVMEVSKKYDVPIGNVFHAGDGNLHPLIMFDERDEEEKERVLKAGSEILKICADLGGTISGEHGVGIEKLKETRLIFCEQDLEFARQIKKAFDPMDLLNPGKMIPEPETTIKTMEF